MTAFGNDTGFIEALDRVMYFISNMNKGLHYSSAWVFFMGRKLSRKHEQ